MATDDNLRKRMEELERENRRLKEAASGKGKEKIICYSLGDYKGSPTNSFHVNGRHFTLGVRKATIAVRCVEELRDFVRVHNGELADWVARQSASKFPQDADASAQV